MNNDGYDSEAIEIVWYVWAIYDAWNDAVFFSLAYQEFKWFFMHVTNRIKIFLIRISPLMPG